MSGSIKGPVLLLKPALLSVALTGLILVLLAPIWLVGATFGTCLLPHPNTFIGILWQIDDGESTCSLRATMLDDLTDHHLKPGTTKQDVVALLGEPADPGGSGYGGQGALIYGVGCWIDCNWLVVQFDAQGRLTESLIYQD